jgi:hypothetical protein
VTRQIAEAVTEAQEIEVEARVQIDSRRRCHAPRCRRNPANPPYVSSRR